MSKTIDQIREACLWAKANGHTLLSGGAWFDFTMKPWGCDALGALLLQRQLVTKALPTETAEEREAASHPGYSALAMEVLGEDTFWLRRFWLGWDRGFQVMITNTKDEESKDDVSASAIALWRELK